MNSSTNFSIITDFGCPFSCNFCVTNSQKTKKPFVFDKGIFDKIKEVFIQNEFERISVSGGGEPLFIHTKEIENFYEALFDFGKEMNIPIHVHTNIDKPNQTSFLFEKVTISINYNNFKNKFLSWTEIKNKRYVHVSNGNDLFIIKEIVELLPCDSQLTIKQLDNKDRSDFIEIINYINDLRNNGLKSVMFLPSGDYNTYFSLNDHKIYDCFSEIKFK